jgi:hypothetical protein
VCDTARTGKHFAIDEAYGLTEVGLATVSPPSALTDETAPGPDNRLTFTGARSLVEGGRGVATGAPC